MVDWETCGYGRNITSHDREGATEGYGPLGNRQGPYPKSWPKSVG